MPSVGVNLLAVVRCVCPIPAGSCRSTTQTLLTMRWSAVTVDWIGKPLSETAEEWLHTEQIEWDI